MKFQNRYYILRHGQTIYQTKKKDMIYPQGDKSKVGLTKEGIKKVSLAAKRLKTIGIDLIYSSDFYRTRQTAKIVNKKLGLKEIVFDKRLRDVNLGIYCGGKKEDFRRDFSSGILRFSKRPSGGENWQDVQKRTLKFLKEIDKKHQRKTILIISHGDPLWLLERRVRGLPPYSFIKSLKANYIQPGELRKL